MCKPKVCPDCNQKVCPDCNQDEICRLSCPAVTTHLSIVAEIINRLTNNSNYCKTVCVTIVAVFFTFSKDPNWASLAIWAIPIIAITLLDSLFVYLKKKLTAEQEEFISQIMNDNQRTKAKKINSKMPTTEDIKKKGLEMIPYVVSHSSNKENVLGMLKNIGDISIWLFYFSMLLSLTLYVLFNSLGFIYVR